jgi:hypothetical protein
MISQRHPPERQRAGEVIAGPLCLVKEPTVLLNANMVFFIIPENVLPLPSLKEKILKTKPIKHWQW